MLKKVRTSLNTRGIRAYISLKRQFVLADQENSGFLSLNQWLTAFDDLKVANLHSGDLKMLFGIFDLEKHCQLDYNVFLRELYGELPQNREQLVLQAF